MSNVDVHCDNGAVRIIVRERPVRDAQGFQEDSSSVISYLEGTPNVLLADGRPFTFDKVLGPNASQEQLFRDVSFLVEKVKQGYNCTALAYGQTGTGKSYSMGLNYNACDGEFVGIIPRCLKEILNTSLNNTSKSHLGSIELNASFIEIYNEKVFDLLSDKSMDPISSRGYKCTGGTRKVLKSLEDCYSVLLQGNKNRHVRPTKMNSQSSRSHAIFTIHINTFSGNGVLSTRLNLVDLAGSEGVRRTGHQGMAMSEGVNINQGLLSIGKVLQAKALGHKVVPYRDSVLTSVLQDSLNDNSYLTLLACISPHRSDLSETLSTLRFAQSVKQLKHSPHINFIATDIKKNRLKTPKKPLMTPVPAKPPFSKNTINMGIKVLKPIYHSNTFCTPSKLKRYANADKLNRSEIGLTPKQKEKEQTGLFQSSVSELPIVHSKLLQTNRESTIIMDKSLDSRASIMSLNVSSSTVVGNDGIASSKVISYSPVVRKCMVEIENVMDSKMSQLMETLKDLNKDNIQHRSEIMATPWPSTADSVSAGPLPLALRNELKTIIQEVLKENVKSNIKTSDDANRSESILLDSSLLRNDPKCQLFATSSPVFKVPSAPNKELNSSANSSKIKQMSLKVMEIDEEAKRYKTAIRRSRRISAVRGEVVLHSSFNDLRGQGCINEALRRSSRISKIGEQTELQRVNDSSVITLSSMPQKENIWYIERRKEKDGNGGTKQVSKAHNKASHRKSSLNNNIIESYFTTDRQKSSSHINGKEKKSNILKHRAAVLNLLNSGSMKELQVLPQIGQKTAYQLVTQRTLNGKFKNISQLEKLTIWRGSSWTRFAQANLLID
ncbi:kinesin-like protein Nod [Bactrocera neohumeralis]|uniref:kinesin-like protein Nod n=1 Tax=Bactrocera neohumeralis TaxID=98809 RepID=UPI00216504F4|nr:kinesin-like protein Nod [Bactrocera neohumeralis]XP_050332014.1 kinesin-like protein Nod [Bactrocera neohumeralis]XP_050332015.1 kinesin-like protein Nod [Bactrocera neohumeralis]